MSRQAVEQTLVWLVVLWQLSMQAKFELTYCFFSSTSSTPSCLPKGELPLQSRDQVNLSYLQDFLEVGYHILIRTEGLSFTQLLVCRAVQYVGLAIYLYRFGTSHISTAQPCTGGD